MATLKQKVCKDCFYENELPDCPNLCPLTFKHVKEWLQQKQKLEPKYTPTANKIRAILIRELLEELEENKK